MPGQSGEYSESGRCPLYSTPASFGGECSRVTEQGISVKLGEGIQACAAVVSGLVVAFYFSWQVSLVCLAAVPLMAFSFGIMLFEV